MNRIALLFEFVIDAGMVATEGACADYGYVDGLGMGQRGFSARFNCESFLDSSLRLSQFWRENGKPWRPLATVRRLGLPVGAEDGVNPGLIAALLPEPFEQVGVEANGHDRLAGGQHNLRVFPEGFVGGASVSIGGNARANCRGAQASKSFPVSSGIGLRGFTSRRAFRAAPNAMPR